MPIATSILVAAMAFSLAGCALRAKPAAKAAPPAKPLATAPVSPPPPPPPLSSPQTNVQLPAPQPIVPEALATTQPQEEEVPAAPPVVMPKPSRSKPPATPRAEPPAAAPAAPVETGRQPVQEVIPPEEQKRLLNESNNSRREIDTLVKRARARRLTGKQRSDIDRIDGLLKLSEDAERSGDLRKAADLASRALIIAKELQ